MAGWNDEKTIYTYDAAAAEEGVTLATIDAATENTYVLKVSAREAAFTLNSEITNATIATITDGTATAQNLTLNVSGTAGSSTLNLSGSNKQSDCPSNITISKAEGAETAVLTLGTITGNGADGTGACYTSLTINSGVSVKATGLNNGWGLPAMVVNGELNISETFRLGANNRGSSGYIYSGNGTITTKNLLVTNYGGTYNFTVDNLVTTGTVTLEQGTTTTFNGTTLSLANKITNNANLKFTGNTTIDITSAVQAGTIVEHETPENYTRSEEGDGWAKNRRAYTLVTGNAAILNNGVILTVKNGEQTLSTETSTFDGKQIFASELSDTQVWYVKSGDTSTSTLAGGEAAAATGVAIDSGKTLTMDTAKWNLSQVYGAGNVVLSTDMTINNSAVSNATGDLTVQSATLTIGTAEGQTSSISSFSSVILDNGQLYYNNRKDTLHRLTVEKGKTGTINSYDMQEDTGDILLLDGKTTINGDLTIQNQWNAQFNIANLTGSGNLYIKGTNGGNESSQPTTYTINFTDSSFTGNIVANNSKADITLALAQNGTLQSSQLTKTAARSLTLSGSGTYTVSAINTQIENPVATIGSSWTGTVALNTVGIKNNINNFGRAGSTIALSSVNGWVTTQTVAANLRMNAGTAFQFVDGNRGNTLTFSGKVSGAGNMLFDSTLPTGMAGDGGGRGATHYGVKFTGNLAEWTGTIVANDTAKNSITAEFGQATDSTIAVGLDAQNGSKLNLITGGDGVKTFTGAIKVNNITTGGAQTVLRGNVTTAGAVTVSAATNLVLGWTNGNAQGVTANTLALNSLVVNEGAVAQLNYTTGSLGNVTLAAGTLFYRDSVTAQDAVSIGTLTVSDNSNLTKEWKGNLNVGVLTSSGNLAISNYASHSASTDRILLNISSVTDYTGTMSSTADKFDTVISAANQSGTKSGTITQDVTLADGFTKDGTGTLNLTGTTTFAGSVAVNEGSLNLAEASVSISDVTLGCGAALTLGSEDSHNASLTTSALTVTGEGEATLNANLIVNSGTITFNPGAVLTMGCDVIIGERVAVYISGDIQAIRNGTETVTLFNGLTSPDEAKFTQGAQSIYVNNTLQSDFFLVTVADGDGYKIVVAPEPATATLSLLALAGLMARRKRR